MKSSFKTILLSLLIIMGLAKNAHSQVYHDNNCYASSTNYTSAIGKNCKAYGQYSFAGGWNSRAGKSENVVASQMAFAFGYNAIANGKASISFGYETLTEYQGTAAIGYYVQSKGEQSFVFGSGGYSNPLINEKKGIMFGVNSPLPSMFISAAPSQYYTGKVAIGNTTNPAAKLHIKADNIEDADIMLEPGQNKDAKIMFRDKESFIKVEKSGKMTIAVPNKPIFFNASKYYINSNNTYIENKEDIDFNVKAPKNINVDAEQLRITGKVGINMENTHEGLDVAIAKGVYAPNGFMLSCNNETGRKPIMLEGCVNINTGTPYADEWFSLAVKGGILAEQVLIKSERSWPDFVFASDYELMPLSELKSYIETNRHLPDVPSESQVNEQGVEVGEMQSVLLKKIEELTLYTIQLQEQVEQLQQKVNELETK